MRSKQKITKAFFILALASLFPSLALAQSGTWTTKAPMPTARWASSVGVVNGILYVAAGYNPAFGGHIGPVEAYDPVTNSWTSKNWKPSVQTSAAAGVVNGILYAAGGTNCCIEITDLTAYDPTTDTWTTKAPLPAVRQNAGAGVVNGQLHVVGGTRFAQPLASHDVYNPVTNTWTSMAPLPMARTGMGIGVVNGILYAVGGNNIAGVHFTTVEAYDPTTNSWTTKAPMPTARSILDIGVVDGILYAVGGANATGVLSTVEAYDPATNTWTTMTPMPTARADHVAGVVGGLIYVVGGYFGAGTGSTANEAFTPPDATPPQVSCGAPDGAWHKIDVTIACTASDPVSGLANAADASFTLTTTVPIGTETANAATNSREVCNNAGGCTTAGSISGNKVDKKAPTMTITSPAASATYQLNAIVGASYACGDGGSGVASCQGTVANASPIDTSSLGTKTFMVTSTDNVGNPSALTSTYSVVSGGGGGKTSADVGITLSAPSKVSPGGTLTYSMTVTNAGKLTASGVVVSDAIPAGTVFASASASQGTVTAPAVGSNGTVTVNLGSLANGATATISVVVTVTAPSGTVLTDTAKVTATTQDLNSGNNSATQKTTVK